MIRHKKKIGIVAICIIALVSVLFIKHVTMTQKKTQATQEIKPSYGTIRSVITTTGTVEPQNRLEIKPPISGRVEDILVREGMHVKKGDVLALMSSTERAALLDAAQMEGDTEVDYWKNVYKATPLIAPIDGEVIVRAVEPGQTVSTTDAIIVLSDRLIVSAQVDETDVGGIAVGQKAVIGLDAYPDIHVDGTVDHISYESTLVNNVTIYEVEILPAKTPSVFRSGMSANVTIIKEEHTHVLLLPIEAVTQATQGRGFVTVKDKAGKTRRVPVETGLMDDNNIEICSGITANDTVIMQTETYQITTGKQGTNPFLPSRGKRK